MIKYCYLGANLVSQKLLLGAKRKLAPLPVKIAYYEAGNPLCPTVVFIHGFGDSKESTLFVARHLIKDFHFIALDLPGFGQSDAPTDHTYTLAQYAKWLKDFFDYLKLPPFHLMGNSLGGAITLQLALTYPHLMKSLVLIGSAGIASEKSSSLYDEFYQGKNIFKVKNKEEFEIFLKRIFYKRPYFPKFYLHYLFTHFKERGPWHEKLLWDLMSHGLPMSAQNNDPSFALNHRLSDLSHPSLIVWGAKDSLFPVEMAMIMNEKIQNSKLIVMDEIGHCPQVEGPKEFACHVKEFIAAS